MTEPTDLLADLLDRAEPLDGATAAQMRAWANRSARAIAAQVEPMIAAELLERASLARPVAEPALEPVRGLSAVEMIRQYRLRTAASAPAPTPTNVRDFPR
jgi:hypothetical protein